MWQILLAWHHHYFMFCYWWRINEFSMVKEYTRRYKGFQIRDVAYLGDPPQDAPIQYDVVRWAKDNDGREYCWSVGNLVYDPKEPCFDFESIGLRWLEANPDEDVINWVIKWCEYKLQELDTD